MDSVSAPVMVLMMFQRAGVRIGNSRSSESNLMCSPCASRSSRRQCVRSSVAGAEAEGDDLHDVAPSGVGHVSTVIQPWFNRVRRDSTLSDSPKRSSRETDRARAIAGRSETGRRGDGRIRLAGLSREFDGAPEGRQGSGIGFETTRHVGFKILLVALGIQWRFVPPR